MARLSQMVSWLHRRFAKRRYQEPQRYSSTSTYVSSPPRHRGRQRRGPPVATHGHRAHRPDEVPSSSHIIYTENRDRRSQMASSSGLSQRVGSKSRSVSASSVGNRSRSEGSTSRPDFSPAPSGWKWVRVANSGGSSDDQERWVKVRSGPEYSDSGAGLPPPPEGYYWDRIIDLRDPDLRWALRPIEDEIDVQRSFRVAQAIRSTIGSLFSPHTRRPSATARGPHHSGKRSGGTHGLFGTIKQAFDESRVLPAPPPRRGKARQRQASVRPSFPPPPPPSPPEGWVPPPPPGAIPVGNFDPLPFVDVPNPFAEDDPLETEVPKKKGRKGKAAEEATAAKDKEAEKSYTLAEVKPPDNYRDIPPIKLQKPVRLDEAGTLFPAFALVSRDRDKTHYVRTDDKLVTIQRRNELDARRQGVPQYQEFVEDLWTKRTKRTKRDQAVALPKSLQIRLDGRDYRLTVDPSTGAVRPVGFPYHFIPRIDKDGNFIDRRWEVVPPPPAKAPKKGKKTSVVLGPGDPWPAEGPWPDVPEAPVT